MIDRRVVLFAPLVVAGSGPASAQSSPWSRDTRSAVRLISAGLAPDAGRLTHRAGVHITMVGQAKTYWRSPGDSGVPPLFDFSGSDNLAEATISYPAPKRFPDGGGFSIGYSREVVFPVDVVPRDPARPVTLVLALDYAVCDTVCIPAKGAARLVLDTAVDAGLKSLLARHSARVPRQAVPGLDLALGPVERSGAVAAVMIRASVGDAAEVDLFAEGPNTNWALPLPEPVDAAGAERRFRMALEGLPRGVDPVGQTLTFTLVTETGAIERRQTLA